MTLKKLLNYIAKWQHILRLDDWVIGIKVQKYKGELGKITKDKSFLYVTKEVQYKRAVLFIDPKNIKNIDEEAILHEVIHVRLAELTELFNNISSGNDDLDAFIDAMRSQAEERIVVDFMHVLAKQVNMKRGYKTIV